MKKRLPEDVLKNAIDLLQQGVSNLPNELVYELQNLPHDKAFDPYRSLGWDLFNLMIDQGYRKHMAVLVTLTLDLMYPLLSKWYFYASQSGRYDTSEDLRNDYAIKIMEEWIPNYDRKRGEFSSYVINRVKRVALEQDEIDGSEYLKQKRAEEFGASGTISLDGYQEQHDIDENAFSTDAFIGFTYEDIYSGASAEEQYFQKEAQNMAGKQLRVADIHGDVKLNVIENVNEKQAQSYILTKKLCGGTKNPMIAKALDRMIEQQKKICSCWC